MSDLEEKAVGILDKLEALTAQYAPDVTEAAISAVQVSGFGVLLTCLSLAISVYALYKFNKIMRPIWLEKHKAGSYGDWDVLSMISLIVSVIVAVILIIILIVSLSDIWAWTAIFNPKLALAHKILGL